MCHGCNRVVEVSAGAEVKVQSSNTPLLRDHESGKFSFFTWQNTTIIVWLSQADGEATTRLMTFTDALVKARPEGFSNIHLVAGGAPLPTREAREAFGEMMERYATTLACVATVFEGDGFWASAMRGMSTQIQIDTPPPYPSRIFSELEEVADWVPDEHFRRTGVRIQSRHLFGALTHARANAALLCKT
jgi:hypothetical protein